MKSLKYKSKLSDKCHSTLSAIENLPVGTLFTDIETTGLSSAKDQIYCIGTSYIENNNLIINQFFAETKEDEKLF